MERSRPKRPRPPRRPVPRQRTRSSRRRLLKAKKPQSPKKTQALARPFRQETGGNTLKILDTARARRVEITGRVERYPPPGDLMDGMPARPGRHSYVTTVTVTLKDANGNTTATRTFKGQDLRPLSLELGSRIREVAVRGEFGTTLTLNGGRYPGTLDVDATASKFRGATDGAKNQIVMNFAGEGAATLNYRGSETRDNLNIVSNGFINVDAGAGDDRVIARGGRNSYVDAGDGNDFVHVAGLQTRYYGGRGRDDFSLPRGGSFKPVQDFDDTQDQVVTSEDPDR